MFFTFKMCCPTYINVNVWFSIYSSVLEKEVGSEVNLQFEAKMDRSRIYPFNMHSNAAPLHMVVSKD